MSIRLYAKYRRMRLRDAWRLSGMSRSLKAFGVGCVLGSALVITQSSLDAFERNAERNAERRAEQRSAVKVSDQQRLIATMSKYLDACLRDGGGSIWINDKLHLCGLADTGERR